MLSKSGFVNVKDKFFRWPLPLVILKVKTRISCSVFVNLFNGLIQRNVYKAIVCVKVHPIAQSKYSKDRLIQTKMCGDFCPN